MGRRGRLLRRRLDRRRIVLPGLHRPPRFDVSTDQRRRGQRLRPLRHPGPTRPRADRQRRRSPNDARRGRSRHAGLGTRRPDLVVDATFQPAPAGRRTRRTVTVGSCPLRSPKTTKPSPPPSPISSAAISREQRRERCSTAPTNSNPTSGTKPPQLGWLGLHVPEQFGGSGYSLEELVVVVEELGRGITPGAFVPTMVASAVITAAGDPEDPAAAAARPRRRVGRGCDRARRIGRDLERHRQRPRRRGDRDRPRRRDPRRVRRRRRHRQHLGRWRHDRHPDQPRRHPACRPSHLRQRHGRRGRWGAADARRRRADDLRGRGGGDRERMHRTGSRSTRRSVSSSGGRSPCSRR